MYKVYHNDNWVSYIKIVDTMEEGIQLIDKLIEDVKALKALPKEEFIFLSKYKQNFAKSKRFTIRDWNRKSFDEQPVLYSKKV